MEDVTKVRIVLISLIIVFGFPGNLAALIITVRSTRQNWLNRLAYVHLAMVDLLLCSVFSSIALAMDSLEYVNHYHFGNEKDFGEWEPLWKFLHEHINFRLYMSCTFISTLTLTFIAGCRTWRIFNPFRRLNKYLLLGFFVLSDAAVILLAFFFQMPRVPESATTPNNYTIASEINFTDDISVQGIPLTDHSETLSLDFGADFLNTSSLLDGVSEASQALLSGKSITILMAFIGASIILTAIFYLIVCIKLRYEFLKSDFGESIQRQQFLRRQIKHLITHVALITITITTLLPAFLFAVLVGKAGTPMIRFVMAFAVVSSALNPYVYCILLPSNKAEIMAIFRRCRSSTNTRQSNPSSNSTRT